MSLVVNIVTVLMFKLIRVSIVIIAIDVVFIARVMMCILIRVSI